MHGTTTIQLTAPNAPTITSIPLHLELCVPLYGTAPTTTVGGTPAHVCSISVVELQ
ncbi:MAG: hypothetical protein IPG85_10020 [Bacteroidetes bacterium]|nr:hypothetical protein [Bacteroidota bacterium]